MFRELHEEVGLHPHHVRIIARTRDWLRYEVPDRFIRRDARGHYKGQKQIWYLLQLVGNDWDLNLRATDHPEFDAWRWNDYWVPLDVVVEFKRGVYEMALTELSRFIPRNEARNRYLRGGFRANSSSKGLPGPAAQAEGLQALDSHPHEMRLRSPMTPRTNSLLVNSHVDLPPGASFDPDPGRNNHS